MNTKHGILTSEGVLYIQGNTWQVAKLVNFTNLSDLFRIADQTGLTHLWVPEIDGMTEPDESFAKDAGEGRVILNYVESGPYEGLLKSAHRWGTKDHPPVAVVWPEHTRWSECWDGIPSDKALLVTIAYMEQALGVPVAGSPSTVGWKLLEKMHPDWVKNFPKVNLEMMHFGAEAAADLVASPGKVKAGQVLHKVDRNSAYLSASAAEFYGVGNPELDSDGSKYDGKRVGTWYCRYTPSDIVLPQWKQKGLCWLATPIIRLMRTVGYEVEVLSGNYFPESHQIMAKWAKFLWEARISFQTDKAKWKRDEPRELARQGIKMIAVATVGLTAYKGFDETTSKQRPDIRTQTVARTYELVYHNMLKFYELTGMMPVMMYTDALYYATEKLDIPVFDPMLKRKDKLGGYKYEGYIKITTELAEVINSDMAVSDKLATLNKTGWTK